MLNELIYVPPFICLIIKCATEIYFDNFPVVRQKYEVQVRDAYVFSGNTGVLRCEIPAFVKEYIAVTSWVQDSVFNIYPSHESGKLYTGIILNATKHDIAFIGNLTNLSNNNKIIR